MEAVLAQYENQINVFSEFLEDLPDSEEPVWVLGQSYNSKTEKSALLSDVRSRLWFTYRRKFSPIGGTGPSSDTGWGCMLRCGQMILAQALICSHLGRRWRWASGRSQPPEYQHILHCFLDRKDSCYSIHQMAQMGVGEGKSVGEWYGPNTVAQVLRKLTLFDDWSSLAVYVSMDNTVVIEDIKMQCRQGTSGGVPLPGESSSGHGPRDDPERRQAPCPVSRSRRLSQHSLDWRPLLLLIPLRMGINSINPIYIQTLKVHRHCVLIPSYTSQSRVLNVVIRKLTANSSRVPSRRCPVTFKVHTGPSEASHDATRHWYLISTTLVLVLGRCWTGNHREPARIYTRQELSGSCVIIRHRPRPLNRKVSKVSLLVILQTMKMYFSIQRQFIRRVRTAERDRHGPPAYSLFARLLV
ncbi:cysteine protease ATG4A isoform 1-T1 [Clarias gariepinus]